MFADFEPRWAADASSASSPSFSMLCRHSFVVLSSSVLGDNVQYSSARGCMQHSSLRPQSIPGSWGCQNCTAPLPDDGSSFCLLHLLPIVLNPFVFSLGLSGRGRGIEVPCTPHKYHASSLQAVQVPHKFRASHSSSTQAIQVPCKLCVLY